MGSAPSNYTIQHVIEENKVTFEGESQVFDVLPKGQELAAGQELRGWLNPNGKHGPYFKIAEDRPGYSSNGSASSGGGRDNEGQIIGWAHTLAAFELAHNLSHADVQDRANHILSARSAASTNPPAGQATSPPAESAGAAKGPDTAAAQSANGEDIPF